MRHTLRGLAFLLVLIVALPAFSDDQQKAKKELNKVTAMATDGTGRRIVNMSMADVLKVKRSDLVMERRDTGLNYGSLFVAHQLMAGGAKMEDIAAQLKAGKDIFQIANDLHGNWKQIAEDAKKLNAKIDDNLYKHFTNEKADDDRDQAGSYSLVYDGVKADNDVSPSEISQAQDRYLFWRDRGRAKAGGTLDLSTEAIARQGHDHIRNGGLQPGQPGGATAGPPK